MERNGTAGMVCCGAMVNSIVFLGNAGMAGSGIHRLCKAWIGRTGEMRNSPAVMGLDRQDRKGMDCNITDRHGIELQDWQGQDWHRKMLMGDAGWERLAVALRSMVRRDPDGCCSAGKERKVRANSVKKRHVNAGTQIGSG